MEELNKSELMLEEYSLELKGHKFIVKPLTIREIMDESFKENDVYKCLPFAVISIDRYRNQFENLLNKYVTYEGEPPNVELLTSLELDIQDVQKILAKMALISG